MHCAAVPLGDRLDQRQPESDAAVALAGARQAVERLEDAFAQGSRHAGSAVVDMDARNAVRRFELHRNLALAVAARVFQQVADRTTQQPRHAAHGERRTVGAFAQVQFGIDARAFFGAEPGEIDRFDRAHVGLARVEPAGQQDLVDQLVELADVAGNLVARAGARLVAHQFQAHADAGER